jgi:hypothetical protein
MKAFDRYVGCEVDLPKEITPGRFRLKKAARFNSSIMLSAGDLIFSDGQDFCEVEGFQGVFRDADKTEKGQAKRDLLIPAITTLAQIIRDGNDQGLSTLIPAKSGELARLADLEKKLGDLMKHLREIDHRPRFSMHYEADVSALSRAKRIAPSALTYLAAHSEDWHRRTISDVQPKRILALFSEDEWATYENRVYVRLLDRLDKYLRKRLADLNELESTYKEALSLGDSTELDHRLRNSLCQLWGEALSVEDTGILLDATTKSIDEIRTLQKQISVLRQGELYGRVPRNCSVPEQLRDTNILQHDPHYRHLRTLWLLYQKRSDELKATPSEVYDRNKRLFDDYVTYVGMALRRVLSDSRFVVIRARGSRTEFTFGHEEGTLKREGAEWILNLSGTSLTIVPGLFCDLHALPRGTAANRYVPIFLFPPDHTADQNAFAADSYIVFNPTEFYGLERLRALIEPFLWKPILEDYAKPLLKMPGPAVQWLSAHGCGHSKGQSWELLVPAPQDIDKSLSAWLNTAQINSETQTGIIRKIASLKLLSTCRGCGHKSTFHARQDGFIAKCEDCGLEWGIYNLNGKRRARFSVVGVHSTTFENYGSWCWELGLNAP